MEKLGKILKGASTRSKKTNVASLQPATYLGVQAIT